MIFNPRFVRIWDAYWAETNINDSNFPKIREAINSSNHGYGPVVVMSDPDENGIISLNSRWDILLHPALGDENVEYINSVFAAFFDIKEEVRRCYQKLQLKQQTEEKKERRPIGFPTTQDETEEKE